MKFKALGIAFISLMLLGVWFTYATFTQQFTSFDEVTLKSSKTGLQLPARADIKVRGMIVGQVLDFEPTADGVDLTLGIDPDLIGAIPANVTGAIYPKTLFGEKFVDLQVPSSPSGTLAEGDVIVPTRVATEVEQVLSDLIPLLRAVQPRQLNASLNAIATALEGRGESIGNSLEVLDRYLKRLNPELPGLVEDLRLTAQVSGIYADVVPEIASILRNSIITTQTLEGREAKLRAFFQDVAAFSGTAEAFLDKNEDNIIRVGELSQQQLKVFAKYAPEYPCLLQGITNAEPRLAETYRGYTLHINLKLIPHQPRAFGPQDDPVYGADTGPYCGTLPNPTFDQVNVFPGGPNFDDGVDEPTGKGTIRTGASYGGASFVGSSAESEVMKSLLAPTMGVTPEEVSDLGVFLVGPMARGAEVSYR